MTDTTQSPLIGVPSSEQAGASDPTAGVGGGSLPAAAPASGDDHDLVKLGLRADRLLALLARLEDGIERVGAQAAEQIQEITTWADGETRRLHEASLPIRQELEAIAGTLVEAEPLGRKSVQLLSGRLGFRSTPGRVVIEDETAATIYLMAACPDAVRVRRTVDIATLRKYAREIAGRLTVADDAPVPGVIVVEPEERFYIDTVRGKS